MHDSFGGEGDEYLFALSPGGRRPDGGSLPFKRGGNVDGIVLGLLRHEDGVSGAASWASWVLYTALMRRVGCTSSRIKRKRGSRNLFRANDARRIEHGFLFSEVLLVDGSLLFAFILKSLPVIAVGTYGFVRNPKSQPAPYNCT